MSKKGYKKYQASLEVEPNNSSRRINMIFYAPNEELAKVMAETQFMLEYDEFCVKDISIKKVEPEEIYEEPSIEYEVMLESINYHEITVKANSKKQAVEDARLKYLMHLEESEKLPDNLNTIRIKEINHEQV